MKYLLLNFSDFRKRLDQGSSNVKPTDYPCFCLILGYMLTKIQDFNTLHKALEDAFSLLAQDKLPQTHFFEWLMLLYEKPYRLYDCIAFLENVQDDQNIDIIDEIQTLISSDRYQKKPLAAQNRYNSIDTVVMENQKSLDHRDQSICQKNSFYEDQEMQLIKKMQEDEQMARQMQEEQQNMARQYKGKMNQEETMCEICYVDLYQGNPSFLDKCGHGFHQDCLTQSFKAQISDNNFPLKCPNQQCKIECLQSDIKLILTAQLYKKYQDHTLKAYADMHGDSVSWCPTADCGYMFFYEKDDEVRFQCLECKKQYCLNCRCQWHKDMTCAQYKVSTTVSQADKQFLEFVKGKKFKQCPKCKFWVQKNQGCDHMTCKCKFEFCYKCGGIYMKCECVQKARQQAERRRIQREQTKKRKQQRLQKKLQQKVQSSQKKEEKPRRGRSKKDSKK